MQRRAGVEAAAAHEQRANEIAALLAHPGMPAALRMFCQGVVDLFEGSRLLNLIVSGRGRVAMSLMAVYLDTGYDPLNPLSGLTVNRYKAQCAAAGLCSPGRAAAMLGLMRFAGHLQPAARAQRGQPLRLIPTDKMLGSLRERWRRIFSALAQIGPRATLALPIWTIRRSPRCSSASLWTSSSPVSALSNTARRWNCSSSARRALSC